MPTRLVVWPRSVPICTVVILEVVFDPVAAAIRERILYPPGVEAAAELGLDPEVPPPERWQLRTIRASVPALAGYSLPGVCAAALRAQVTLRLGRSRLFGPDADYEPTRHALLRA